MIWEEIDGEMGDNRSGNKEEIEYRLTERIISFCGGFLKWGLSRPVVVGLIILVRTIRFLNGYCDFAVTEFSAAISE